MKHEDIDKIATIQTLAVARGRFKLNYEQISTIGFDYFKNITLSNDIIKNVTDEYEKSVKFGAKFVPIFSDKYPPLLRMINNPPICLVALGNIDILTKKSIGMVGSRNASYNGLQLASHFAKSLSDDNWVVTSGLAKGIDAKSHIGAIKSTIAVIGGGIQTRYPVDNSKLYDDIITNNSCIITEFGFDVKPIPANFPQRNRIIAGISYATLIVEAGMKSGSLVTARLAREFNREVFAIPGFPLDEKFRGNNFLIKRNIAKLVESVDDIFDELRDICTDFTDLESYSCQNKVQNNDLFESNDIINNESVSRDDIDKNVNNNVQNNEILTERDVIMSILSNEYLSIDEICKRSKLPAEKISVLIMEFELEGLIFSNGINGYCRKF